MSYNPRLSKKINHLSRAINKIDEARVDKLSSVFHNIKDIKVGINEISFKADGVLKKVRYDEIEDLNVHLQASLRNQLTEDRKALRQQRALEQIKTTGKITHQFKRSLKKDNPKLLEQIEEFEEMFVADPEDIVEEFKDHKILTGEEWFDEANEYFQKEGSLAKFDFYDIHGTKIGFTELNAFTWNIYKVARNI